MPVHTGIRGRLQAMRKLSYERYSRKPMDARKAIQAAYRGEAEGAEYAARAIARRLAGETEYLRYRVSHPSLSYYAGGESGRITVEMDAEISKVDSVRILSMLRIGQRLHKRFNEFLADEFRWRAEDRARKSA